MQNEEVNIAQERHMNAYMISYSNKREENITVDVCEPDGYLHHAWEECICSGTPYLYITPEKNYAQQITSHLKDVHDNLGFKRVYFDKINAYEPYITTYTEDKDGNPLYDWKQVDEIYEKILGIGVKPFVMIAAIPKALASDPGNTNFDGGNSSAPKDFVKWKRYCKSFVMHLLEKFGEPEVSSWYFQILNEPELGNLYWSGTFDEYLRSYDYAATGIKEINKNIKVGPGGFASTRGHLIASFIDHVTSFNYDPEGDPDGAPFDYINTHGYPLPDGDSLRDDFEKIEKYMVSHFGPDHNKELIISEWNSDAGAKPSSTHDGSMNAAFIIRQMSECSREFFNNPNKIRFFSFWCHSDVYDELGEPDSEFPGLFGLITRNGIRKPNYNAFKMLHMLGRSRIGISGANSAVNGIATYNNEKISIILYNCIYDIRRSNGDAGYDRIINLNVKNIPWPKVKVEHYRIDDLRSNSYTAWKRLGCPKDCTDVQMDYLKDRMDLELLEGIHEADTITGTYRLQFELPMPSVSMIVITPVEREYVIPDESHYTILGSLK